MPTLESLRAFYTGIEKVRRPSREVSPFMSEYLRRKGEIHEALKASLQVPEGSIVDEMPPKTEIPAPVEAQITQLQAWLEEQNFREIPADVRAQLEKLEAIMRQPISFEG